MQYYLAHCGILASIWIVFGVFLTAKRYHNYNHMKQFCSELGAKGSPTEKISPIINNYPLGLFFCLFGLAVIQMGDSSLMTTIVGGLIIIHGIGTWVVGYFPMDADPFTETPTLYCQIHLLGGSIMLLALLIAPIVIIFSPTTQVITENFKAFSLLCILSSIYFTYTLSKAYKNKRNIGLHQRLSYGSLLVWLSGFSLMLR